jgi:4-alpha-glucanotransferase
MRAAMDRFDAVRIEHFIGLHHAYEKPNGSAAAFTGSWRSAPGDALLAAIKTALGGALPFVAEDLGSLTPSVTGLRDRFGPLKMKLLQDAIGSDDDGSMPHRHAR